MQLRGLSNAVSWRRAGLRIGALAFPLCAGAVAVFLCGCAPAPTGDGGDADAPAPAPEPAAVAQTPEEPSEETELLTVSVFENGRQTSAFGAQAEAAFLAVIESCQDRMRQFVTDEDYKAALAEGRVAALALGAARTVTVAGRDFEIRDALLPLDEGARFAGKILARSGDKIHTPFVGYDAAKLQELLDAIE